MGTCFSENHQNLEDIESDAQNDHPDEATIRSRDTESLSPKKGTEQKKKEKYKSNLIQQNLINIIEEDPSSVSIYQNSLASFVGDDFDRRKTLTSSMSRSSILLTYQQPLVDYTRSNPLGKEINSNSSIVLLNLASQMALHSHAIKYEGNNKQHEVCTCSDKVHDYDHWQILADHNKAIQDKNIVLFHHVLTSCNMRSNVKYQNVKSKTQQVCCTNSLQDIQDEDYWKIELIYGENYVQDNSLIKIKHLQTNGYLKSSKFRAIKNNHNEVQIAFIGGDTKEIWIVKLVNQE